MQGGESKGGEREREIGEGGEHFPAGSNFLNRF